MGARKRRHPGGALHRLLLSFPAETAHRLGMTALQVAQVTRTTNYLGSFSVSDPRLTIRALGCLFPNPIGLAAGFDKDGVAIGPLAALGFGGIEVGTVTPRPQRGNPRPRLFRHRGAESLENAMGFNNAGAQALEHRLERARPTRVPLGVNLGKNKTTPHERVVEEYSGLARRFDDLCDYLVVNVSSPNTPGLRDLQTSERLLPILEATLAVTERPVLLKLSPDLDTGQAVELAEAAVEIGAAGVILTNTTIDYSLLASARRIGGLSGRVLTERSFELLRAVAGSLYGRCLLVSVGGIDSGAEVYRRLRAGAGLVQLYTALAYHGPALLPRMLGELLECLERDGFETVSDAVGVDVG